ncbi:MAG: DUF374 domain-containing protein [Deltaproteobacteria bacterium]|nr:DUF374 domain-containing protein [Deltaproteobacteria bacterium]
MMKNIFDNLLIVIAPRLGFWLIRFIWMTMGIEHQNLAAYEKLLSEDRRCILAFWHGRLLMMPCAYKGKRATILVSQHRDGELIARAVRGFGIESVRGSSTRGWLGGVKGLLRAVRSGSDLVITPDGPKGPERKAWMGVVLIAKGTGMPILPVSFSASKKKPSKVGIPLSFPTLFQKGCLSTASLSM